MTAIDHWKGEFGNEYTKRQTVELGARERLWSQILPIDCKSVLEVGANVGANLVAIKDFAPVETFGCEPNDEARKHLATVADAVTNDTADRLSFPANSIDLVFTCGVLIHIPPDKIEQSMREIHRVSKRWIICGEYFSPKEEEIPYRGKSGLMWRRDYGSMYLDMFQDLQCTETLFAWKRTTGLDNITFWVFEKQ